MADYIEREAAIAEIEKQEWEKVYAPMIPILAKQLLTDLPSADVVERKKGKWLLKDRDGSWACWTCSKCGRLVHLLEYKSNVQEEYPFCHCGADMKGADNE